MDILNSFLMHSRKSNGIIVHGCIRKPAQHVYVPLFFIVNDLEALKNIFIMLCLCVWNHSAWDHFRGSLHSWLCQYLLALEDAKEMILRGCDRSKGVNCVWWHCTPCMVRVRSALAFIIIAQLGNGHILPTLFWLRLSLFQVDRCGPGFLFSGTSPI